MQSLISLGFIFFYRTGPATFLKNKKRQTFFLFVFKLQLEEVCTFPETVESNHPQKFGFESKSLLRFSKGEHIFIFKVFELECILLSAVLLFFHIICRIP